MGVQHDLAIYYCQEYGSILPAKMKGIVYRGVMFGSEITKRCRELVKEGIMVREWEGKFKRFYLKDQYKEVQMGAGFDQLKATVEKLKHSRPSYSIMTNQELKHLKEKASKWLEEHPDNKEGLERYEEICSTLEARGVYEAITRQDYQVPEKSV